MQRRLRGSEALDSICFPADTIAEVRLVLILARRARRVILPALAVARGLTRLLGEFISTPNELVPDHYHSLGFPQILGDLRSHMRPVTFHPVSTVNGSRPQ
jgi:hypothetical protein